MGLCARRNTLRNVCFSALQRAEIAEIDDGRYEQNGHAGFSAPQRAEIAEILPYPVQRIAKSASFSALQRAEIAEIISVSAGSNALPSFSALQRAEIAEIRRTRISNGSHTSVSVLFNEPKLLKSRDT